VTKITKEGVYRMPAADYHADPCPEPSLSNSLAQVLLSGSLLKAWWNHPRLNTNYKHDDNDKFDLGTAEDESNLVIVQADDWRSKDAREARDRARGVGKIALLAHQHSAVTNMVTVAKQFISHSDIADEWKAGQSEQTFVWKEDGVWLRSRLDRVTKDRKCIIDYKSTSDASPEGFQRQIIRMGYHIQDAFYRRAVRHTCDEEAVFVFLAQEIEPPHECSLHACDPALQEISDAAVERAIGVWRDALKTYEWPSYGGRIHLVIPPNWLMSQHELMLEGAP